MLRTLCTPYFQHPTYLAKARSALALVARSRSAHNKLLRCSLELRHDMQLPRLVMEGTLHAHEYFLAATRQLPQ